MPMQWTDKVDRDLMVAMFLANHTGNKADFKITVPWAKVMENMGKMGYAPTKESVSQRWSKVILWDARKEYPELFTDANASPAGTPAKAAATMRKRARKVKTEQVLEQHDGTAEEEDSDNSDADTKPPRKKKTATTKIPKQGDNAV
ncbi:Uu.00g101060.m01.CDS01 [Anthostomella pinea]|uniref:Uu.00g101060.m01.CDS01 n=1 Tax=Anthostomella pinea TaxID=933095 RepID=A0AAI8YFA3_9PEZI|nr:Uu.00g101060.m01.CDS01 [Anthostomella pinea]